MKVEKRESPDFLTAVAPKEIDQAVGGGDIGPHRMRASAPVVGQIAAPTRRKRASRMPLPV